MLYEGKGTSDSPEMYRGIDLKYNAFAVITKHDRIFNKLKWAILDEQHDFMTGHSTIMAARHQQPQERYICCIQKLLHSTESH
jgi:hypothetical protein